MKRDRKKGTGLYKHKPHSEETRQKIRDGYARWLNAKKERTVDTPKE